MVKANATLHSMPFAETNGIRLAYDRAGQGIPVLLIMGSSASGRVWTVEQTPALNKAGYETITFDNRGIAPSDVPEGKYSLDELVGDTAGLIETLDIGPACVIGASMGAIVAQELAIRRPDLVRCAVLIATRARADAARLAQATANRILRESGIRLPPGYAAAKSVFEMLSPATLNTDESASSWLEIFELSGGDATSYGQAWVDTVTDRRAGLRQITAPCMVIAYSDDLICPPHLGAEVAEAIPGCGYLEIADCGHLGHLERPAEVNSAIIEFLDKHADAMPSQLLGVQLRFRGF